jgi:anti-sigma B factor antagonist
MQLSVETIKSPSIAVVSVLSDEFEASNTEEFKRQMTPVIQTHKNAILDLSRVKFVDSSGCGAILSCLKALSSNGGDLKLCQVVAPNVRKTFELIRLHKVCEIYPTRAAAIQSFSPPA